MSSCLSHELCDWKFDQRKPPLFRCSSPDTTLKSGCFRTLLFGHLHIPHTLHLFGITFQTPSFLINNGDFIFRDMRRRFEWIRAIVFEHKALYNGSNPLTVVSSFRKEVCEAFTLILGCLHSLLKEEYSHDSPSLLPKLLSTVLLELKHLLLQVKRVKYLEKYFKAEYSSLELHVEYSHLCLDVWCNALIALQMIREAMVPHDAPVFCSDMGTADPLVQVASLLLHDLTVLAVTQATPHNPWNSKTSSSPFSCPCIAELWIMIIKTLDRNSDKPFWELLLTLFKGIVKLHKQPMPEEELETFVLSTQVLPLHEVFEPVLWFLSYLAPLYKYDSCGNYLEDGVIANGGEVIKCLLKSLRSCTADMTEKNMRNIVFHTSQLIPLCMHREVFYELADYFMRKVESTFCLPGAEVKTLRYLHPCSLSWFNLISRISCLRRIPFDKECSFIAFLHLLCTQLRNDQDGNFFGSFKSRIYIKFIPRKVKSLSEVGLQNLFTLVLVIAQCGQTEMTNRVCEYLTWVESLPDPKKEVVVWKALFTLMLIHQEQKTSIETELGKILASFQKTCTQFTNSRPLRLDLLSLITVYVDSMGKVVGASEDFSLGEQRLISPDLEKVFLHSRIRKEDISNVLNVLADILSRLYTRRNTGISYSFLGTVANIVHHLAKGDLLLMRVSDAAAALTGLAFLTSSTAPCFVSFFTRYLEGCKNPSLLCRYLHLVVSDNDLSEGLKADMLENFSVLVFQSWLKLAICLPPSHQEMQLLTVKAISPQIQPRLFAHFPSINIRESDHMEACKLLSRAMGFTFQSTTDLVPRAELRKFASYFDKFVEHASERMNKECSIANLRQICILSAYFVTNCSTLLYRQYDSTCMLVNVVDKVLFPDFVFINKMKEKLEVMCAAIRNCLSAILRGLLKLDYKRDKTIERFITYVLVVYLPPYPLTNNPLLELLKKAANGSVSWIDLEAFEFLFLTIKNKCLNSEQDLKVFHICFEVLKSCPMEKKFIPCHVLLIKASEVSIKKDSAAITTLITRVFQYFQMSIIPEKATEILGPVVQWLFEENLCNNRGLVITYNLIDHLPKIFANRFAILLAKRVHDLQQESGQNLRLQSVYSRIIDKLRDKVSRVSRSIDQ